MAVRRNWGVKQKLINARERTSLSRSATAASRRNHLTGYRPLVVLVVVGGGGGHRRQSEAAGPMPSRRAL